jgi:hypothetical protein
MKNLTLVMPTILAIGISSQTVYGFERFDSGDTAHVACEGLVVYERPTTFARPVKSLQFGAKLKVAGLEGLFELPSTDYSSKKFLSQQEQSNAERENRRPKPIPPEKYTRAAWLKVDGGYAAASCLVTSDLIGSQTKEEVLKRVEKLAAGKAKRNFSEDESGDMTAMRGAAGKAKGGKADYETMDRLINAAQGSFDLGAHEEFRKNGRLGEFQ